MKLEKIIKREEKANKYFLFTMIGLFILLPLILFLSNIKTLSIYLLLGLIETLIILAILIKTNYYKLSFSYSSNRLKIKSGLFSKEYLLMCDKISIIHTEKFEEDIVLVFVTTVNIRNKALRPITKKFFKKYPEATKEYQKLKEKNKDTIYYYQVIKRGGFKKYLLLDLVFKNAVRATITNSAIENIKISRGQSEI